MHFSGIEANQKQKILIHVAVFINDVIKTLQMIWYVAFAKIV